MPRTRNSTVIRRVSFAASALLLAGAITPACAAKVYRCGNAFQDQPCTTDKEVEARAAAKASPSRDAAVPIVAAKVVSTRTSTSDRATVETPRGVTVEVRR